MKRAFRLALFTATVLLATPACSRQSPHTTGSPPTSVGPGGPAPSGATAQVGADPQYSSASTPTSGAARPPLAPFPEVSANGTLPRVTPTEAKALTSCGPANRIQVEGYVVQVYTCFCSLIEGRTVCAQPCLELASIRPTPQTPKEQGFGLFLPRPSRELFEENGYYVVEGECVFARGPVPTIMNFNVTARSRLR